MGEVPCARSGWNRDAAIKASGEGAIVGQPYGFSQSGSMREHSRSRHSTIRALPVIHGAAVDPHSNIALVMELADGVTLLEHVRAAPIPVDEVVAIAAQIG